MSRHDAIDLTNCDREPIHIPGSIQPHGTLLVCDAACNLIIRHAVNAAALLGVDDHRLNGGTLDGVVGPAATHEIRNAMARSSSPSRPGLAIALPMNGKAFDLSVHRYKGNVIIECEPAHPEAHGSPLEVTRALTGRLSQFGSIDELVRQSSRLVRGLLGYDRVMIYRFAHDGAGQVVSESKRPDLESFSGQYFPASDIPAQARALYLMNTIRIISDATGDYVPIEPVLDLSGEPLDLSHAHLRSVSPIHLEYLRNMGVAASMSISIIVGGSLWGLIACHHYKPRVLSLAQRVAAEMFGEFFSLHLEALSHRQKLEVSNRARDALDRLMKSASAHADIVDLLRDSFDDLMQLMPCDGIGLWMNGVWSSRGTAPPPHAVPGLARFISTVADRKVWATHALIHAYPPSSEFGGDVAGVLAIPMSQLPRDYLFFFRREVVKTIDWGGNPEKTYETGPHGDRLTPRKSFAIWKQTVADQSQPWLSADREIAEATRAALVETVLRHTELIADERSKSELRRKMLNEELNHRVKNILALIKSLVSQPPEPGRSLEQYVRSLKGRVQALGNAHDQVVRGDGGGALLDLLNAELSPYRGSESAISVDGPAIAFDARAFSVMALVLHELATNAAKYGALSVPGGGLSVHWTTQPGGACEIHWRESGGPLVAPPRRQGFGSVLVNRSIPFDLGGVSEIAFYPSGVEARFVIPGTFIHVIAPQKAATATKPIADDARQKILKDASVLLVEDQLLIAMDAESMLIELGVGIVETASSAADGLKKLATFAPDAAVLDVNLGYGTSIPVAEELARRKVPFIFATGYGDNITIPRSLGFAPVVRKPYDSEALASALAEVISGK